jgi:hypothetical protein
MNALDMRALNMYVLQTDTCNSACDVLFDSDMVYIGTHFQDACDHFFEAYAYDMMWDDTQIEEEKDIRYRDLSPEEAAKVRLQYFTDKAEYHGKEIHVFPFDFGSRESSYEKSKTNTSASVCFGTFKNVPSRT